MGVEVKHFNSKPSGINYKNIKNREKFKKIKHEYYDKLPDYINNIVDIDYCYKKSVLVSEWTKKYVSLQEKNDVILNKHKNKERHKYPKLKRGQILYIDFGFNIDGELGGIHYGIVLNKKDDTGSPVITVAPLTSYNPNKKKLHYTKILIKDDILKAVKNNLNEQLLFLESKLTILKVFIVYSRNVINSGMKNDYKSIMILTKNLKDNVNLNIFPERHNIIKNIINCCIHKNNNDLKKYIFLFQNETFSSFDFVERYIKVIKNNIRQLNKIKESGSLINIDQVTTISKLKILEPNSTNSFLHNTKVSDETLSKIDKKLKSLFTK